MMRDTLLAIRSTLFSIPAIVIATMVAAVIAVPAITDRRFLATVRRFWARVLLRCAFVNLRAEGARHISSTNTCIICCNHQSYIDPPALLAVLPGGMRFVAKQSLFRIPFLGWGMKVAGDIAIDRDTPRAAARSLAQAAALARSGVSLVIFPEGGRSLDGRLQPFYSGAFRLAIEAQVPIVPAAIRGTRDVLRPGSLLIRGGDVQLTFGAPISPEGMTKRDQAALERRVEDAIRMMLENRRRDSARKS